MTKQRYLLLVCVLENDSFLEQTQSWAVSHSIIPVASCPHWVTAIEVAPNLLDGIIGF